MGARTTPGEDALTEPLLLEHLQYILDAGQLPRSVRERRFTVLRAARYFGHPVADVTRAELVTWRRSLDTLGPSSTKNSIVHLTMYLRWLVAVEYRDADPSPALVRPKLRPRLPRPMGDAAIAHCMDMADQPLRAWIALGAFCGLRCMEIAKLTREDVVDVDAPFLRVLGKGEKERIVPLPASVLAELRDAGMPRTGYLFTRMDSRPGPPSAMRVSERINDHFRALGYPDTAHALRHRFGTKLYQATHDLLLVATVMGHQSVETTTLYVRLDPHQGARGVEEISTLATA